MKFFYFFISILFGIGFNPLASAQNLLQNPSFEDSISGLPPTHKYSQKKYNQVLVKGWYQPTGGTPDFYNSDLSYVSEGIPVHTARTGEGRIGLIFDNGGNKQSEREKDSSNHYKDNDHYKEFISARFLRPMVKDSLYEVKFYMVQDKRSNYVSRNVGVYFSDTAILYNWAFQSMDFTPQIICNDWRTLTTKNKWVCMKSVYKAKGGERYLTFGSFGREDPQPIDKLSPEFINVEIFKVELFRYSSYYYVDDFSIVNVTDTAYYNKLNSNNETTSINNFVFLLDISNSMVTANYIDDMKRGITEMIDKLKPYDQISLLTFDAKGKIIFEKYKIGEREKIISALENIKPGGRSNINDGLHLACEVTRNTYISRGNNTIVLATDGTFKIAKERIDEVKKLSKEKKITVDVIQFGAVESKDLKKLAAKCDGKYNQTAHKVDDILVAQIKPVKPVGDYTPGKKSRKVFGKILGVTAGLAVLYFTIIQPVFK